MKHRRSLLILCFLAVLLSVYVCHAQQTRDAVEYRLAWQDDFDGSRLDTTHWSIIERGPSEWQKFMSPNKSLFRQRNGYMRLYARQNDNIEKSDTAS